MQKFELALKNEKAKLYQRLGWFLLFILTLLYTWFGFFSNMEIPKGRTITFLSVIAIVFLVQLYFKKTKYQFGLSTFFIILTFGWIAREQYLFAGITLFFQLLHQIATRKKKVSFDESQITFPSFPLKTISWGSLNNCLLKDGLLTIDFRNNKIIQQVIDESKTSVNEQEFNEFCQAMLKAIKPSNN